MPDTNKLKMLHIPQDFVSVSQAMQLTGKSISTLRRFIDKTKKLSNSSELLIKKDNGKTSPIYIKKEYLLETFGGYTNHNAQVNTEILQELKERIKFLEQQLQVHQNQKIKSDEIIYQLVKEVSDLRQELKKVSQ
jgi:hypothetical protein